MRKYSRSELIRAASRFERLLCALGVHPTVAEQSIGDLEESYHECAERFGRGAARRDYVRQLLRSLPHLGVNAWENGTAAQRARLVLLCATGLAVVASSLQAANRARLGPPAEIFAEHATADLIVVNNMKPALLPMRVVDSRGHELDRRGIEYRWLSGQSMRVSPHGEIACPGNGDARVRASAGEVSATVTVRCRPVAKIESASWITLIEGGADKELPFMALGPDGKLVTELRGALRVKDSTVATLSGASIRPVSAGQTEVVIVVGDVAAHMRVAVHRLAKDFSSLGPEHPFLAVPIRLRQGDTVRIQVPGGAYWVKYIPRRPGDAPPTIGTEVTCGAGDGLRAYRIPADEHVTYCMIMLDGGWVSLGHGFIGAPVVEGYLAVERAHDRW